MSDWANQNEYKNGGWGWRELAEHSAKAAEKWGGHWAREYCPARLPGLFGFSLNKTNHFSKREKQQSACML